MKWFVSCIQKAFINLTQILAIFKLLNIFSGKVLLMQDIFHLESYFRLKVLLSSFLESLYAQLTIKNQIEIILMIKAWIIQKITLRYNTCDGTWNCCETCISSFDNFNQDDVSNKWWYIALSMVSSLMTWWNLWINSLFKR